MTMRSDHRCPTPLLVAILFVPLVASACRKSKPSNLEPIQKMAYAVKPAVVRVNAFSTATFRYPTDSLLAVEKDLRRIDSRLLASDVPETVGEIETGAGGSGSGFVIHPSGYILTSGHVVSPTLDRASMTRELLRNGAIAALLEHFPVETLRTLYRNEQLGPFIERLAKASTIENIEVFNEVELSNGEKARFDLREYSPSLSEKGIDVALLRISRENLPTVKLADSSQVHLQESIWLVGYPAVASTTDEVIGGWLSRESDLESTVNPGTITAIKRNVTNTPVFQTNVGYQGNSGGPAVNQRGEVVGISTWGHTKAEQIKFLVPINVAKEVLTRAKVPVNVEGKFNGYYSKALDQAWAGNWSEAKKHLARAEALFPNSPDLIRFMRDADAALVTRPMWLGNQALSAAVASILAFGLVSTVVFLRPRRRFANLEVHKETWISPGSRFSDMEIEPASELVPGGSTLGKFTILNGDRAGERLGLGGSGIRIGRESTVCEIVLENPKISRLHAEVVSVDGKVLLIDRNSSNGTFVNDQKIDRRYLKDGDIIYFGGRNAVAVAFQA